MYHGLNLKSNVALQQGFQVQLQIYPESSRLSQSTEENGMEPIIIYCILY